MHPPPVTVLGCERKRKFTPKILPLEPPESRTGWPCIKAGPASLLTPTSAVPGRPVPPPVLRSALSPYNRIYGRGLGYITRGQSHSYPVDVFINLQLLSLRPKPWEGEPHVLAGARWGWGAPTPSSCGGRDGPGGTDTGAGWGQQIPSAAAAPGAAFPEVVDQP